MCLFPVERYQVALGIDLTKPKARSPKPETQSPNRLPAEAWQEELESADEIQANLLPLPPCAIATTATCPALCEVIPLRVDIGGKPF